MHKICFVIPVFNEERLLEGTLESVFENCPKAISFCVVVVDHGSTDRSCDIAKDFGKVVSAADAATVAELRNRGVMASTSELIVFLDADVRLTCRWKDEILNTIQAFDDEPRLLTGSRAGVSADPTLIERHWFLPMASQESSHIGTGHLIVRREFFEEIGGFDEALQTGEDYDFSVRAIRTGGRLSRNQNLAVTHEGYPRTTREFFRREVWHGIGDAHSVSAAVRSKVALLALAFVFFHGLMLAGLFFSYWLSLVGFWAIVAICLTASFAKYRRSRIKTRLINTYFFYIYLAARATALFKGQVPFIKHAR